MNVVAQAYQLFSRTRFPLPSESQVARLEERIGVPLPADYRRFLLEYNGGYFCDPRITPPDEECPSDALNILYGLNAPDRGADLASESNLTLLEDNDPMILLPIGYTVMGNLLYLVTDENAHGTVGTKFPSSDRFLDLVDGIEEFFALLQPPLE